MQNIAETASTPSTIYGHEAGFIVGETSPLEFTFVSNRELLPPRLEYLVVPGFEEKSNNSVTSLTPQNTNQYTCRYSRPGSRGGN